MSILLEILGKAITIDTAELIWHWLNEIKERQNQQTDQNMSLTRVISLASEMKVEAAKEQLRLYLFDNPSCVLGRIAAAAIYIQENQLQNAIEELNSIYMRHPNNTMALYALGHCYERLDQQQQAVEFYQDCLKFKNYLQLPRQRLAAIYFKNSQLEKTILEYELLKSEYPDDISSLIILGHLYIAHKDYVKAADTFNTAILIHPDNFNTDDSDIDKLIREGQLYPAMEHIDNLLQAHEPRPDLLLKRADILGKLDSVQESIHYYEQALNICPDFLEATIKLGTQYLQLGNESLAAMQFNKAVEINDKIVDAYIGLAIAQKLADNPPEALATLSLAASIQPNSSLLLAQAATLQFKAGLQEKGPQYQAVASGNLIETVIAAHQMQIEQSPNNPDLYYRLGVLLMGINKLPDALNQFQAALDINPTFNRAKSKLLICLFDTHQKEKAHQYMTKPDCLDHDTLNLHYKTALLYCDKVKFASSLLNLEQHMQENFACADTTVNISIILQNLGLLDRASTTWDNLIDTANHAINANQQFPED
ncbi:MAG: tetratricopeptide repeat protein [Planctomycetes bacterium]|nr:tetratricopeptide repeat protein [Planctomycetota bacterium]